MNLNRRAAHPMVAICKKVYFHAIAGTCRSCSRMRAFRLAAKSLIWSRAGNWFQLMHAEMFRLVTWLGKHSSAARCGSVNVSHSCPWSSPLTESVQNAISLSSHLRIPGRSCSELIERQKSHDYVEYLRGSGMVYQTSNVCRLKFVNSDRLVLANKLYICRYVAHVPRLVPNSDLSITFSLLQHQYHCSRTAVA